MRCLVRFVKNIRVLEVPGENKLIAGAAGQLVEQQFAHLNDRDKKRILKELTRLTPGQRREVNALFTSRLQQAGEEFAVAANADIIRIIEERLDDVCPRRRDADVVPPPVVQYSVPDNAGLEVIEF